MQQASPNQVFTPPSVSAREFKRESIPPTEDYREHLLELEKEGELEVQRVPEPYIEVETKFGRIKKIPEQMTWHHHLLRYRRYSDGLPWVVNRRLNTSGHHELGRRRR